MAKRQVPNFDLIRPITNDQLVLINRNRYITVAITERYYGENFCKDVDCGTTDFWEIIVKVYSANAHFICDRCSLAVKIAFLNKWQHQQLALQTNYVPFI